MNKPGEIVQTSGIYETVGGRQAALSKGDRFPPTAAGAGWSAVQLIRSTAKRRSTTSTASSRKRKRRR